MEMNVGPEERSFLLKVARDALYAHFTSEPRPVYYKTKNIYQEKAGLFMRMRIKDDVRAYGGILEPQHPLLETVQDLCLKACFYDERVSPVSREELDRITIQMALVLSLETVVDRGLLKVGEEGLLVQQNFRQAVLLPWDISSLDLTPDEYIRETALKAGIRDLESLRIRKMKLSVFEEHA
jgi:uncharacterized protein (TIGR00296 family)